MKKFVMSIVTVAMLAALIMPMSASAASKTLFADVKASTSGYKAIKAVKDRGGWKGLTVKKNGKTYLKPKGVMKKKDFYRMVKNLYGKEDANIAFSSKERKSKVKANIAWAIKKINSLSGSMGVELSWSKAPKKKLSKKQAAKIVKKCFDFHYILDPKLTPIPKRAKLFNDVSSRHDNYKEIKCIKDNGGWVGIEKNNMLYPNKTMTKVEFKTLIKNLYGEKVANTAIKGDLYGKADYVWVLKTLSSVSVATGGKEIAWPNLSNTPYFTVDRRDVAIAVYWVFKGEYPF